MNVPDYYLKPFDDARDKFFWAILSFTVKKNPANLDAVKQSIIAMVIKANEIYIDCEDQLSAVPSPPDSQ